MQILLVWPLLLPSPASVVLLKPPHVDLLYSHLPCLSIDILLRFGTKKTMKRSGTWKDTRMRTLIWQMSRLKWHHWTYMERDSIGRDGAPPSRTNTPLASVMNQKNPMLNIASGRTTSPLPMSNSSTWLPTNNKVLSCRCCSIFTRDTAVRHLGPRPTHPHRQVPSCPRQSIILSSPLLQDSAVGFHDPLSVGPALTPMPGS